MEWFRSIWEIDIVRETVDALLKLGLAALLSGIIGFEREHTHRPAGFRTHILGALGSAPMWAAVFADVGVCIIAVINASSLLIEKK